jgi:hypothetical protein
MCGRWSGAAYGRGRIGVTFEELLNQALAMLQRQGRVSYRALKRQFSLDDAYIGSCTWPLRVNTSGSLVDHHRNKKA